jgi:hypothetical protein
LALTGYELAWAGGPYYQGTTTPKNIPGDPTGIFWGNAANWWDVIAQQPATNIPGGGDEALFGILNNATPCIMNVSATLNRVAMDSGYAGGILTIPAGVTLASYTDFIQYGTLNLLGGTATTVRDFFVNGPAVANPPPAPPDVPSHLTAGNLFITNGAGQSVGSIAVVGYAGPPPVTAGLIVTAGSIDDAGPITVGGGGAPGTGPGALDIYSDSFTIQSNVTVTINGGSVLTYYPVDPGPQLYVKGTILFLGGTLISYAPIKVVGAGGRSLGGSLVAEVGNGAGNGMDTIKGNVSLDGSLTVGDGADDSLLDIQGNLTVDSTGKGTLNNGGTLTFSNAPSGSTFDIKGEVDMYGATIVATAIPDVHLDGGTLATNGADTIIGKLTDNGTLQWGSNLHTLTVQGDYTQGATGSMVLRIQDPRNGVSDRLYVSGAILLGGNLTVNAQGTLPDLTMWDIILDNNGIPDGNNFDTFNLPPNLVGANGVDVYQLVPTN